MMTRYDELIHMNKEQLAEFLDNYTILDDAPWSNWFAKKYCANCGNIHLTREEYKRISGCLCYREFIDCSYCQVNRCCKFFPDIDTIPSTKDMISMWLDSGSEE